MGSIDSTNISTKLNIDASKSYKDLVLSKTGIFSIDNKVLTNEQLCTVFDYTKFDNKSASKVVETIFKHEKVMINKEVYNTTLDSNGSLVSVDGKTTLNREKIEKVIGPTGYDALVCKTTKDIDITDKGLLITDKEEKVEISIPPSESDNIKEIDKSDKDNKENSQTSSPSTSTTSTPSSSNTGGSSSSGNIGSSIGGAVATGTIIGNNKSTSSKPKSSSNYPKTVSSSNSSSSTSSSTKARLISDGDIAPFTTSIGNNKTILVEFDGLDSAITKLNELKGNLNTIASNFSKQINSISSSDAWLGPDKDLYVSQKSSYASNLSEIVSTLDSFVSLLQTYKENYLSLESVLASKTIS